MYIEDVKTAININTIEERITLKRWLLKQLEGNTSKEKLIQEISTLAEKDRNTLQKRFKITL
jgi:hypothetical protein